jgi:biopolymer transport protein ExbD
MKKSFGFSQKKLIAEPDITSLLDILTILIVFLLSSYSSSHFFVDQKNIRLSSSDSTSIAVESIVLVVDSEFAIFVNNKKIGILKENNILNQFKDVLSKELKFRSSARPNTNVLNLVLDKNLPFQLIQPFLVHAKNMGFKDFKIIVKR